VLLWLRRTRPLLLTLGLIGLLSCAPHAAKVEGCNPPHEGSDAPQEAQPPLAPPPPRVHLILEPVLAQPVQPDWFRSVLDETREIRRFSSAFGTHHPAPPDRHKKRPKRLRHTIPYGFVRLQIGAAPAVDLEVYEADGGMRLEAVRAFADLLGLKRMTQLDPRLLAALYALSRDFDRTLRIPAVPLAVTHPGGPAVDVFLDGISTWKLAEYCWTMLDSVSVGYRPRSGLVHLEVRDGFRVSWVDFASAGSAGREQLTALAESKPSPPHLEVASLFARQKAPKDSKHTPPPPKKKKKGKKKSSKSKGRR